MIYNILKIIVDAISFEPFLTYFKWPNGGTVIFIRTLLISIWVILLYILLKHSFDPTRTFEFSFFELQLEIIASLQIYGAIFAGIYLALYSRYAAQWSYLADLYNQIKQTESANSVNRKSIAEWKAGFIEDAIAVHLARRPMFAIAIKVWTKDKKVKRAFVETVHNGKSLFKELIVDINKITKKKLK